MTGRKVGIVATLGPASGSAKVLDGMVRQGLSVARLNFSHGTHKDHLRHMERVRKSAAKNRRRVRILQDLEGFRIRVCKFKSPGTKKLVKNTTVWLTKGPDTGDDKAVPFDFEGDLKLIKKGQLIYIDDGNIILKAKKTYARKIAVEVVEGGQLKERKGINMPGVKIPFSSITDKDLRDLDYGMKHGVDFVAQSFVRVKEDITEIKDIIRPRLKKCRVIAKIESKEAIKNIDSIIDVSDGIMVARGDMGIAVPIYEVPMIQKWIIRKCNRKKKFVITATQMLEHMTQHARPTRAEVTDVANAILDGTDYVMLSEETASGRNPVASVRMMRKIIEFTQKHAGRIK